mmetsp:Transcript_71292/g.119307  ORF Transcript_71292/g.119307 Transcript_71292/m.119307 type:complete len:96 (-) Transcript_71292:510-797(-)
MYFHHCIVPGKCNKLHDTTMASPRALPQEVAAHSHQHTSKHASPSTHAVQYSRDSIWHLQAVIVSVQAHQQPPPCPSHLWACCQKHNTNLLCVHG